MNKNIKKVVIVGPECTGKSELSQYLAEYFKTIWVPEYARDYIEQLNRPYDQEDLLTIAYGQLELEDELIQEANHLLFCDTNLYVIKVWSEFKYSICDIEILRSIATRKYDLYLLMNIDIPWQEDPQREHPHKREQLFQIYKNEMESQPVPFVIIKGDREQRRKAAIDAVKKLLAL